MSKEETACKVNSIYKHKERKPKKPHYIPRPWGKPYNYKCFQCPFTCMEKSHLYNHMKYSLCKNSLSLLIESEWPYKKGNILHPEIHFLHSAETSHLQNEKGEEDAADISASPLVTENLNKGDERIIADNLDLKELPLLGQNEEVSQIKEDEEGDTDKSSLLKETELGKDYKKSADKAPVAAPTTMLDVNRLLQGPRNKRARLCKDASPDFIITDVFSLNNHTVKSKASVAADNEVKMKQNKVLKNGFSGTGILMEQWKLVTAGQRKNGTGISPPCTESNVIPCYPPPAYKDYHDSTNLNLSVLGINYPLSAGLFSCLAPTLTTEASVHPHLGQFPLLASATQLLPQHSGNLQAVQHTERPSFLPRLYYPLLFEQAFTSAESKLAAVKGRPQQTVSPPPSYPQPTALHGLKKNNLPKVPALKPTLAWQPEENDSLFLHYNHKCAVSEQEDIMAEEEKWTSEKINASNSNASKQKPSTDMGSNPILFKEVLNKKTDHMELSDGFPAKSSQNNFSKMSFTGPAANIIKKPKRLATPTPELSCQSSNLSCSPQHLWFSDNWKTKTMSSLTKDSKTAMSQELASPTSLLLTHPDIQKYNIMPRTAGNHEDSETPAVLIHDLCKTLDEYKEVEKKLSILVKEDIPGQKQLKEQLLKIRKELFYVHQTLEQTTKQHEGPLDLSLKRSTGASMKSPEENKARLLGFSSKNKEMASSHSEDDESTGESLASRHLTKTGNTSTDFKLGRSQHLHALFDAGFGSIIKTETFHLGSLELRPNVEPYFNRTTKCEADSSVLCTDGRSNVHQSPLLPQTEETVASSKGGTRSVSRHTHVDNEPL
ncbi:proline-rich protein 35 [Protopterus annectens]|uniref:proline-rich protein 35 n=1 Tax=Protopterus annectens TaxID=7888 RepID=UPI001CFB1FB9|nr:proline-rich protein 35 [Protopterus annectens]